MSVKTPVPFPDLLARVQSDSRRADSLVSLLPVLEHDCREAMAFERVDALRLPELVAFALKEGSSYWVTLALSWLEAGFPVSASVRSELLSISQRSAVEQSIRHRAFALHRKIA